MIPNNYGPVSIEDYFQCARTMFIEWGDYWGLLEITRVYQRLLEITRFYQRLLEITRDY